ncbi:hypothetical protein [Colwellia sp. TT2012]|uniref:hypothetical protein n=1 Tax=Colwellia sp. TT2012 TaxID=1720342 RepID=UPI00070E2ED9|nr:hypothetical protein [Colwellia sp. TT2012]
MNFIKWVFIIVFSLFSFVFLFFKFLSIGVNHAIENDLISNDKTIQKIQKQYVDTALKMSKEMTKQFQIPQPKPRPKISKISFSKLNKHSISSADKLCNAAIFIAMNDRSIEAKQAKKSACSHNNVNQFKLDK